VLLLALKELKVL
jgi:hypothetical protein